MKVLNGVKWIVLGLVLLSLQVVMAQPTSPGIAEESDPIVATINQHDIRLSYVYRKIESLPLGDQVDVRDQLQRFVDSVVQEEVLFQSMVSTNFQDEPDLREQVKATVVDYLIQKYVRDRIAISDAAMQQYYRDNASLIRGENIHVYQILRPTRPDCESLQAKIDSDDTFTQLAKRHSLDTRSAAAGGDLGRFMAHPGPLGFEQTWFEMSVGDMRIFESPQGCHLIRIVDRETPPLPPFENVKDQIHSLLQRNREVALLRDLIDQRSSQLSIKRMDLKPPAEQ